MVQVIPEPMEQRMTTQMVYERYGLGSYEESRQESVVEMLPAPEPRTRRGRTVYDQRHQYICSVSSAYLLWHRTLTELVLDSRDALDLLIGQRRLGLPFLERNQRFRGQGCACARAGSTSRLQRLPAKVERAWRRWPGHDA